LLSDRLKLRDPRNRCGHHHDRSAWQAFEPVKRFFVSRRVSNPRKMDHSIAAPLRRGCQSKGSDKSGSRSQGDIAFFKYRRSSRRSDDLVPVRGKVRHEMAPNKAVAASHQH
jgi:hypothetical protein